MPEWEKRREKFDKCESPLLSSYPISSPTVLLFIAKEKKVSSLNSVSLFPSPSTFLCSCAMCSGGEGRTWGGEGREEMVVVNEGQFLEELKKYKESTFLGLLQSLSLYTNEENFFSALFSSLPSSSQQIQVLCRGLEKWVGGFSWGGRRGLSVGGVGELMKRLSEEFSSNILILRTATRVSLIMKKQQQIHKSMKIRAHHLLTALSTAPLSPSFSFSPENIETLQNLLQEIAVLFFVHIDPQSLLFRCPLSYFTSSFSSSFYLPLAPPALPVAFLLSFSAKITNWVRDWLLTTPSCCVSSPPSPSSSSAPLSPTLVEKLSFFLRLAENAFQNNNFFLCSAIIQGLYPLYEDFFPPSTKEEGDEEEKEKKSEEEEILEEELIECILFDYFSERGGEEEERKKKYYSLLNSKREKSQGYLPAIEWLIADLCLHPSVSSLFSSSPPSPTPPPPPPPPPPSSTSTSSPFLPPNLPLPQPAPLSRSLASTLYPPFSPLSASSATPSSSCAPPPPPLRPLFPNLSKQPHSSLVIHFPDVNYVNEVIEKHLTQGRVGCSHLPLSFSPYNLPKRKSESIFFLSSEEIKEEKGVEKEDNRGRELLGRLVGGGESKGPFWEIWEGVVWVVKWEERWGEWVEGGSWGWGEGAFDGVLKGKKKKLF